MGSSFLPFALSIGVGSISCQLDRAQSYLRASQLRSCPHQIGLCLCEWETDGCRLMWKGTAPAYVSGRLMVDDWCGRAQPIVGSTIARKMGLGSVQRPAEEYEQKRIGKMRSSLASASSCNLDSCPDFPQWWTVTWKRRGNKFCPPRVVWG